MIDAEVRNKDGPEKPEHGLRIEILQDGKNKAADSKKSIGPYLGDIELPEIQNGYYRLIDRQEEKGTDILERASFNFTLGIYDMDTKTLYFCEVDT